MTNSMKNTNITLLVYLTIKKRKFFFQKEQNPEINITVSDALTGSSVLTNIEKLFRNWTPFVSFDLQFLAKYP